MIFSCSGSPLAHSRSASGRRVALRIWVEMRSQNRLSTHPVDSAECGVSDGRSRKNQVLRMFRGPGRFRLHHLLMAAKLTLWSARDSGTEVELIIAALRAYAKARAPEEGVD